MLLAKYPIQSGTTEINEGNIKVDRQYVVGTTDVVSYMLLKNWKDIDAWYKCVEFRGKKRIWWGIKYISFDNNKTMAKECNLLDPIWYYIFYQHRWHIIISLFILQIFICLLHTYNVNESAKYIFLIRISPIVSKN